MMRTKPFWMPLFFVWFLVWTNALIGQCWTNQSSGTTSYLKAVFFIADQQGWAAGASGTILQTTDGGSTWSAQSTGTTAMITSLFFSSANTGWATTSQGDILHTTNGGNTWNIQSTPTTESLEAIYFSDLNNGWVVGLCGTLLSTNNGGSTWALHKDNDKVAANLTAIELSGPIGLISSSDTTILRTTDGGQNWTVITPGNTTGWQDLAMEGSKAIAVGKTVWTSNDSGQTWTQLTNLNQTETTWYSVASLGNGQWLIGGSGGAAEYTNDDGASWTAHPTGENNTLTAISGQGYAVGANGKIYQYDCAETTILVPEMVFVEGGTFTMGCTAEQEPDCDDDERPAHQVTLNGFYLGKYEVTQGEWESLMGENPSYFGDCGSNCPVEDVSWYDAVVFCNRLSEKEGLIPCYYSDEGYANIYGKSGQIWSLPNEGDVYWLTNANGYRLPTEAEWEFAARGGNLSEGYKYAGGNNPNEVAWYTSNSDRQSQLVGSKKLKRVSFI